MIFGRNDAISLGEGMLGILVVVLVAGGVYYIWHAQHEAALRDEAAKQEADRQAFVQQNSAKDPSSVYSRPLTQEEKAFINDNSAPAAPGGVPAQSNQTTAEQKAFLEAGSVH